MSQEDIDITKIKIGLSEVYSLVQILLDDVQTIRARVASALDDEHAWRETEHAKWMDLRRVDIETAEAKLALTLADAQAHSAYVAKRSETEEARRAASNAEAAYWQSKIGEPNAKN